MYNNVLMVADFLSENAVVSPILVIFYDVYCFFWDKMVSCEVIFLFLLGFLG